MFERQKVMAPLTFQTLGILRRHFYKHHIPARSSLRFRPVLWQKGAIAPAGNRSIKGSIDPGSENRIVIQFLSFRDTFGSRVAGGDTAGRARGYPRH
jgi:hypothetical protein